ncbi:MAG: long-chain fatty acid--CoA ligase [Campylobacterales bacterium]|nr:long-chain fatty acid--CoA ligase [Campylobacterales bacterium]
MFIQSYQTYKTQTAFVYRIGENEFTVTYEKLFDDALLLARALRAKKITKGTKVMFVCDNRYEWIVTDLALLSLGAISIPRGSDTPTPELDYILKHSEAEFLIVETEELYERYKEVLASQKAIFIVEGARVHTLFDSLYSYNDLLKDRTISKSEVEAFIDQKEHLNASDIFTLIYTSGTTGTPKGVILTHGNIMHNVEHMPLMIGLQEGEMWLSILPSWHIFERSAEYLSLAYGCATVYSSIKTFAADLEHYRPTLVATVPRLWESMYSKINQALEKKDPKKAKIFKKLVHISTLYNHFDRLRKNQLPRFYPASKIEKFFLTCKASLACFFLSPLNTFAKKKLTLVQEKFGGRLRLAISGGGSLPEYLDEWIDALGIRIVNAYGMTECAPAIAGRGVLCDVFGTLGYPVPGTTVRIANKTGGDVPIGEVGEIWVKGPQVTPGYYKAHEENAKTFSGDGFLKTGDLGKFTLGHELIITGRSKEIIVLANGENVDPSRIESTLSMLPFITDAILVGHDKKGLGLLIVPDFEKLKDYVLEQYGEVVHSVEQLIENKTLTQKIKSKMNELLHPQKGFKPFEKLQNIHFLSEEFKPGVELTNTFKKKRHVIEKKYKELIDKLLH